MTVAVSPPSAFVWSETKLASTQEDKSLFSKEAEPIRHRSCPADWWEEARQHIEDLALLPPDWDSYGARPICRDAIMRAAAYVRYLSSLPGVEAPTVTGTPAGHVGLCWDGGGWSLDASIDPTGLISYVFLSERPPMEHEIRTREITNLLFRLVSSQE